MNVIERSEAELLAEREIVIRRDPAAAAKYIAGVEAEAESLRQRLEGAVEAEREWCREILDVDQRDAGDGRLLATLANMAATRLRELGGR